mmetsp:Transcript_92846/g.271789  ORF Transcript_92846/g.271789 Transcript_92846/m.271789 type:complete len:83 (-) Transcript_92846:350-598(-)
MEAQNNDNHSTRMQTRRFPQQWGQVATKDRQAYADRVTKSARDLGSTREQMTTMRYGYTVPEKWMRQQSTGQNQHDSQQRGN